MARPKKLIDPVATGEIIAKDEKVLNVENFDFKTVRLEAAKAVRPFDGYPLKKIKIGNMETYGTYVVALNPVVQVRLDPSNKKVKTKDGLVQIKNYHSRFIRDYELQENTEIVFDRLITNAKGQEYACAVVSSHNVRAQLFFKYDADKERIVVDQNYMLMDSDQESRLRRVFEQIMNPKLKLEREAAFIAGESTEDSGGKVEPQTVEEV